MGKKGFYYLRKSFQFFKKKSTLLRGKKKRIKIKHNLSKIGSEGKKASLNSQSNHCSWGALPGLGKPSSKNLSWVRRKGGGTEKKSHPRSSHNRLSGVPLSASEQKRNARNTKLFSKKKSNEKCRKNFNSQKRGKQKISHEHTWEAQWWTWIQNKHNKVTPGLKKKYLPKFQYTLSYWKYYMCMFSLEYGWQWYSEKARTE